MKTESEIENMLHNVPAPEPSPDLREKLKGAVRLPQSSNGANLNLNIPFWRRWLPAMGYAVMVLGCVVVLAVQNQQQNALLRQMEQLREEIAIKEEQTAEQRDQKRLALAADAKINDLTGNAADADRLALRLAELNALIARLTAEAADLEARLVAIPEHEEIIAPFDFFNAPDGPMALARDKAASISCVNNLKQIGLAIRIWASNHDGSFAPNFLSMSNELYVAIVLCCPSDKANYQLADARRKTGGAGWAGWPENGGSYEYLGANLDSNSPGIAETVIARCRFHGSYVRGDNSVMRIDSQKGAQ